MAFPTFTVLVALVVVVITLIFMLTQKKKTPIALSQQDYRPFKLSNINWFNHNTANFRFELQTPKTRLGLPIGKHILLRFLDEKGEAVSRPYTPISSDDDLGYFDLLIKIYDQGKMSQHLKKMKTGESIDVRGPMGNLTYLGNGEFEIKRKLPEAQEAEEYKRTVKHIGMLAGGTGITPMMQIIRDIYKTNDPTRISLIFGNITEEDILLRRELDRCVQENKNFHLYYTLDKPTEGWTKGKGFVTTDMIKEHLPPPGDDTLILICGPPGMIKAMENNMKALGYTEDMFFRY